MLKVLGYPILAIGLVMGLQTFIPTAPAPFVPAAINDEIARLPPKDAVPAPRLETAIIAPKPVPASTPRTRFVQSASSVASSSASITVAPWRTAVVSFQGTANTQDAVTSTTAANVADRYELARNIQRELKRVGCYYGEIDGSWGVGSKRALTTFMDRVNASLPTSEPDYILLALIRAQPAAACSVPCPQGQTYANDGRCVPNAILAQARRNGVSDTRASATTAAAANTRVAWMAEVRPSAGGATNLPPPAPLIGRMSIGGPRPPEGALSTEFPRRYQAGTAAPGEAAADVVEIPASGATYTTASLTDAENAASAPAEGAIPPIVVPASPRVVKAKPTRRYEPSTRSVHQIFMHPLGSM